MRLNFSINGLKYSDNSNSLDDLTILSKVSLLYLASFSSLAGDAFAGGFLYGYLQGWDLYKACRMGNASGAQVVTKKGCANFMPTLEESLVFIEKHGGY